MDLHSASAPCAAFPFHKQTNEAGSVITCSECDALESTENGIFILGMNAYETF